MLRVFWAQCTNRISATKPILGESEWNINVWTENCSKQTWTPSVFCCSHIHLSLIKRKAHITAISSSSTSSFPLIPASQAGRDTMQKCCFPLFLSSTLTLLSVSHHTVFHATSLPHSLLALNDTVYTHPASIIPFHTSPGLFICLGCWGDMKAHSLLRSLSHPLFAFPPSLLPSNHCWLLVAIDIRGLIKPWRSCLIYAGGVWVEARKCSKDTSHLLQYLLSYSPGSGEDSARGSFCQLLNLAARFTSCTRLCLVINVCKYRVGCDKNKHRCGIWVSQRVRLGDLCGDQWQPTCSHHLRIQHLFMHTRNKVTVKNEQIKVFPGTSVFLDLILCLW